MKFSVVIPVFDSENTIGQLIDDLVYFFKKEKLNFEIVLVNDGSQDSSWEIIKKKTVKYPKKICAINLLNNHGQHIANYCGFENSTGDYIITMDDDMQNPVSEIKKLIFKSKEDCELIIGEYYKKNHSIMRNFGSKLVRYINSKIFNIPKNLYLSNFRLIKKSLIKRILEININYPYIPGLLVQYSAKSTNVKVKHDKRKIGSSKYNSKKITKLIFEILFNYSIFPLRVITIIGFSISLLSLGLSFFYLLNAFINGTSVEGWTTLVVIISFLGAWILMTLFLLGEYIIRIQRNSINNKIYFAKEIIKD